MEYNDPTNQRSHPGIFTRDLRPETKMSGLYPRIVFYPTLLYNLAMEKISSRNWYDRMDDTVILGALPFRSMTEKLVTDENVKGVITMNEEYETKYFVNSTDEWKLAGIQQLRLDTPDMIASPSYNKLSTGVNFIADIKRNGGSVYVHCKAGRSRSATVVACYLMHRHRCGADEAVEMIQQRRPHILLHQMNWDSLREFETKLRELSYDCDKMPLENGG